MKLMLRHACAIALMLGLAAFAQTIPGSTPPAGENSATTRVMRYKGTIAAPQGVVNVTFSLYATDTGGTALWSETQNVTVDNAGNFSALIGAGTTGGLPESIFLTEAARWLGVAVTGQAENARVLLVSVPYAMSAVEAQRLGGHDASEFVLQSQLSGGSTGGATGGTTSGGDAVAPTVSGTAKFLSKFTAPDSLGDSVIYEDENGHIGIGTTSIIPDSLVQIAGRLRVQVDNAPAVPSETTSVATFTNKVTPAIDQPSGFHQSFISKTEIYGTRAEYQALGGLFEADTYGTGNVSQLFGGYGTVYVGNAANVNQAIAFNNDAFSGFGTTQYLVGLRTSANTSKDGSSNTLTVNQVGVLVDSNTIFGGSVTNNYGLLINNQSGVGTNNWAIKTGTGLVDFGDKTQFAVATANRASLNIPLGVAPSSPQEGDIWNDGSGLKIFSGGVIQSLATTGDLSGFASTSGLSALQSALTAESNARSAADLTLQSDISNEAAIRAAADSAQQSSVTAEAAARTSADNILQSNIDSEATARAAADTSLQSNITSEATTRAAADTTLQNNINSANAAIAAEATARAAADTTLNSSITSIQNSLTTIDSGSAKLATDNVFTAGNDFSGATSTSPVQVVNTLPASCVGGKQMVILSTDPAGKQLYICNSDNSSWSLVGDGAPGAATSGDITSLQAALTSETNARTSADTTLQANIDAANAAIATETSARTAADSALSTSIANETSARTAADTALSTSITNETNARTAADTTLQSNIDAANAAITAETSARTAADTALSTSIANETTARTAADATLQSNIDAANTAVTNEASARAAADTTLQNNINSANAAIAAEATARAAADTALNSSITSIQSSLTTIDSGSAKLATDNVFTAGNDFSGATSTSPVQVVSSLPASCVGGKQMVILSTDPAGKQLYICNSNNTSWSLVGDGAPGAATSGDFTSLQSALTSETNARTAADTTLQANIDAANASIATETSARTAADSALSTSITNETSARQAADTTLQSNIDAANAAITAETSARTSADTALSTSIANETSARQTADTTLQTNITNETSARTAADTTLQSNIDAANTAVTNEASARASADTTLQNNIDAEATTRATADVTLQANIAAEAAARAAADTLLSTSISNVQSSLTTLDSGSAKLSGNNTFTGANDFSGASSTSPVKVVTIATTPSTCVANKDLILKSDAPTGQQLFVCNGSGNGFNLLGGSTNGTVTNIATGAGLTGGPITSTGTISIANGGVSNAMLANSGVTVTAGTGLSGGGAVSLGGSVTLNNTGALSFNGRTGAVSPAANDYSFAQISGTAVASQGGTGLNSSGAAGHVLRSDGTAWASSAIQASDLPSLSSTYVDLSSAQTIAGTKTFSSTISGNISGTAANVTGIVATANGGTGLNAAGTVGNILVSDGTNWTSSAPTVLSGNYVDRTTNQSIAGTKTFTGVVDNTTATQTLPVRAVTVATMGTSCTASKEMIVVTDGQAGRQLWLCNSAGNGWNLLGDGIGGNGVTFNAVNVPANSLLLTKNTCSTTYTGTYPNVVTGQDIPIPPATGTLTQQSTLVVSPISSMSNSMPAGWTSYTYYAYVDASNQAFLHVCNPTQNNVSTLSGGSGAITFNVRAIN